MSETPDSLVPGGTSDQEAAARKHRPAGVDQREAQVAALLTEREGYLRYGRDERVAAVDAQLEHYGYAQAAQSRAQGSEPGQAPKARRSRPAESS